MLAGDQEVHFGKSETKSFQNKTGKQADQSGLCAGFCFDTRGVEKLLSLGWSEWMTANIHIQSLKTFIGKPPKPF